MPIENFNEQEVFLAALDLPEADRASYLKQACPSPDHVRRIESLLRHHAMASEGLSSPSAETLDVSTASTIQFDEFRVVRKIGEGGMGVVYLAHDVILRRFVALKVLAFHLTGSAAALGRFKDEAQNAAAIRHPNIVPVYKFGYCGHSHYLVSEYVDGTTLAEVFSNEKKTRADKSNSHDVREWLRRAAETVAAVADGLDAAHNANIIHRDVKPSNILVERDGSPRLTDFGIAKHLSDKGQTHTALVGSCHYMSPEQASISRERIDQRSDVFSIGVVLYEFLSLTKPFDGEDLHQVLRAVVEQEARPLRKLNRSIPVDLATICHKALEKEPGRRYQTAGHIAADLRCYLSGRPILASPPSIPRRVRGIIRRNRILFLFTVLVALSALTVVTGYFLHQAKQDQLAWLSVKSDTENCIVLAQPIDPATLNFDANTVITLGKTPLPPQALPVGQYRITVSDQDSGAFLEFNWVAQSRKENLQSQFNAHLGDTFPSAHSPTTTEYAGRLLKENEINLDEMIMVAGGSYSVGWTNAEGPLSKRRSVELRPFFIDKVEVSNRDYKAFVDATGARSPATWRAYGYQEILADMPVVGVTLAEAEAYSRWCGKRLPTAFEWQAAARGKEGRDYPWGNNWDAAPAKIGASLELIELSLSWDDREMYECYRSGVQAVDSDDPFGIETGLTHMFGNVREITATLDADQRDVCLMGRTWADTSRPTSLGSARFFPSKKTSYFSGFRCARSACPIAQKAMN